MWLEEFSLETDVAKEIIWSLWADVKNWNKWNTAVEYSNFNGNFENGTRGSVKTSDGSKEIFLFFEIIDCVENKSFVERVKMPLCVIDFGHELADGGEKLKIKHYIKIHGPLTFYYRKTIGYYAARCLRPSVIKLAGTAGKNK